jgi:superfamily I DNA/RNA helicase
MDATIRVLVGSAGTGKTSRVLALLDEAIERTGARPENVLFASLTRAARQEAAERAGARWGVSADLLMKRHWFRTVHAVAFRAATGDLLTDSVDDKKWLATVLGIHLPELGRWDAARMAMRGSFSGGYLGQAAIESYEARKRIEGRVDFTDLLAAFAGVSFTPDGKFRRVAPRGDVPPGIIVAAFDEHQDASPLLDLCCRRIVDESLDLDEVIFAGDPHQSIYGFMGSSPDQLLAWRDQATIVEEQSQTYRCPPPVVAVGETILRPTRAYRQRDMIPADRDGGVRVVQFDRVAEIVARSKGRVFILARCGFSLGRYREELDFVGIPHATLESGGPSQRSSGLAALYSLQKDEAVSASDFAAAVAILPANRLFIRGAKKRWKNAETVAAWGAIVREQIPDAGGTAELVDAIATGRWRGTVDGAAEWCHRADRFGVDELLNPRVRIGTIHSSKGLECDLVIISTECSRAAASSDRDEERRIAYVAVTRTKGDLVIVDEGQARVLALDHLTAPGAVAALLVAEAAA